MVQNAKKYIKKMRVAEMWMLCWICGHIRRDRIKNDDVRDKLGVTSIQENLVQHYLRWFDHIQQRLHEILVRSGILNYSENKRRCRYQLRLTWEKIIFFLRNEVFLKSLVLIWASGRWQSTYQKFRIMIYELESSNKIIDFGFLDF
jgi:hypothetical protein